MAAGPTPARRAWALGGRLGVFNPRRPVGPDDLFPDERSRAVPRIARFVASDGSPHLALVLESADGRPRELLDLTARHGLGPGFLDLVRSGGFELAERELEAHHQEADGPDRVTLEPRELPHRLLSPVDIAQSQLDSGSRLIVGFGLTYRTHQRETAKSQPILFPKPALPTGAYAPVSAGVGAGGDDPVGLLDYELELGCVALRELDLDRLDDIDPGTDFGYLVVNDVSDRVPLLRNRRAGYAQAKGRPTYLPAGPWIVPGEHFTRDAPTLRRMVLSVIEAEPYAGEDGGMHDAHTLRQDARLEDLTLGVRELLELVSQHRTLTMRGPDGGIWPVSVERDGRRVIPAGSLLLTGTPGGTAIRAPGFADRISLVLRGIRNLRWPSEGYRRHLENHRRAFGFLSTGDRVSGWITGLGRQEWEVRS